MAFGLQIRIIPALPAGIFAFKVMKYSFHTIAGLLAGCFTTTVLLGFAQSLLSKSTAVVAYLRIYPFARFVRILSGQILIMLLWSAVS